MTAYNKLLLIIIFVPAIIISQTIGEKLFEDGEIFLSDGVEFFTYPIRADGSDWLIFGSSAAATYMLMHTDQKIFDGWGGIDRRTLNNDIWDIPTTYGIVQYANIASLSTYAVGLVTGEDEIRKLGRLLFQSLSYSGLSVMAFRIIAGRERPYSGDGPWKYNLFTLDNEIQSFPSGHTTVAFAASTVLAEYFDTWYSRVFFYGLATLTAYARIYNNQHWASDVFFGALIGFAGGLFVIDQESKRESNSKKDNVNITPNGMGLSLKISF